MVEYDRAICHDEGRCYKPYLGHTMTETIKKIKLHQVNLSFNLNANKCLELADHFLEDHPEIFFWTEENDSKRGAFYKYENGVYRVCSGFEIENMLLHYEPKQPGVYIPKSLTDGKFQETMRNIKRRRFFYREAFNQENVINFKNGFFDIKKGELMPHTMEIISTIQLPYNYDKDADCPLFKLVIKEALDNQCDKLCILQEFAGYCLTKSTKYEKGLFLVGAANTGKSTILDALEAMLGEHNCSSVRMDMLGDARFVGNLLDKYANIDNEIPQNTSNYEESLKKIVSGQKITINTKFVPTFDAKPFCKLIYASNDFPRISDTSDAIFRRMILLDFNNVIEKEKIDVDLKHKVVKECPGIFNWAYEGLKRLSKQGKFTYSKAVTQKIKELKLLNSSVYYFLDENYKVTNNFDDYVEYHVLYEEYKDFCYKVGAKGIYKKNVFSKEIGKVYGKNIVSTRKTIKGVQQRVFLGLRKKNYTEMGEDQLEWED